MRIICGSRSSPACCRHCSGLWPLHQRSLSALAQGKASHQCTDRVCDIADLAVDMWTTQARCPHADSGNNNIGNNNRRQSFEIGPKFAHTTPRMKQNKGESRWYISTCPVGESLQRNAQCFFQGSGEDRNRRGFLAGVAGAPSTAASLRFTRRQTQALAWPPLIL